MKKVLIAGLVMIATVATSFAESKIFFEQMIGRNLTDKGAWAIFGRTGDSKVNAACAMTTAWSDGSSFFFIKDLIDGEVYIEFINNAWNISDQPGSYTMRINFKYSNGNIRGGDFQYELMNKNTIMIRGLPKDFTRNMFDAKEVVFVMSGTISNAAIPLSRTREAIALLSNCIDNSKQYKLEGADSRPGSNI